LVFGSFAGRRDLVAPRFLKNFFGPATPRGRFEIDTNRACVHNVVRKMTRNSGTSRVLLINPPVYDFAAYDFWAKPMGLLVMAGKLARIGLEPVLVDAMDPHHPALEGLAVPARKKHGKGKFFAEDVPKPEAIADVPRRYKRHGLPRDRLRKTVREAGEVRAALVTCAMTYWYPGAFEAISIVREEMPGTPVILGGGYATICKAHALNQSGADAVISGPAEMSGEFKRLTGIDLGGEALFGPALELYPELDYAPLLTSRGCPFSCDYCASGILFAGFEFRGPEGVLAEMETAVGRGVRDFAFYDDALTVNPDKRLVPVLEEVIRKGWSLNFHTPNAIHAHTIDYELASLMKRAGFVTIRLGVETTASKGKRHDDKLDPSVLPGVAKAFMEAGYRPGEVGAYILAGLPGQKPEEVEEDIKTLWKLGIRPYIAEYSPIPGTALFEKAVEISRYDIRAEPLTQNNSILPCASNEFTIRDLQRLKEMSWPSRA